MASEIAGMVAQSTGHLNISPGEKFSFKDTSYHDGYTKRVCTMKDEGIATDTCFKSANIRVPCHKFALGAASDHFLQMLKNNKLGQEYEIPGVSKPTLKALVDFVYTAEVNIDAEYVKELARSCDQLQLNSLKDACDDFISGKVDPADAIGLYQYAERYNLRRSKAAAVKCVEPMNAIKWYIYAEKHNLSQAKAAVEECMKLSTEEIIQLTPDDDYKSLGQQALVDWISHDDLELFSEDSIFDLVTKWVNADACRYDESIVESLLSHVRLPLCTPRFLVKTVHMSPFLRFPECRKYLDQAISFQSLRLEPDVSEERMRPRKYKPELILLGGVSNGAANDQCWAMKKGDDKWTELTTLPTEQQSYPFHFRACVMGTDLIVTGGREEPSDNTKTTAQAWLYNLLDNTWQDLPSMNEARSAHGIVSSEGEVYVMGGYRQNSGILSSAERLDKSKKQWTNLAPVPNAVRDCHAFFIQDHILLLSACENTTQKYSVGNNTWTTVSTMPAGNWTAAVTMISDTIYVVGGSSSVDTMVYDTKLDSWTKLTKSKKQRHLGFAFEHRGPLVILGGDKTNHELNDCLSTGEVYNPQSNQWSESSLVLPKPLGGHQIVKIK